MVRVRVRLGVRARVQRKGRVSPTLPLQQLLAVAAADELEAQRDLVAPDVEALVAHDVRVLADPEEHRGLMLQHLVGVAHGERLQAGRVSAARPRTATTTGDGRGEFGMGGHLNEP